MKRMLNQLLAVAVSFAAVTAHAESFVATADASISVDLRAGMCRAVGSADVGYSPKWSGVTNAGAYVVLLKVVDGTTNTVATFAADSELSYSYAPSDGDGSFVRFLHLVYSSEDVEIGEPLVRDIAFGSRSALGTATFADSRTNSLQETVTGRMPVALAYSTAWATNAAAVDISAVRLSGEGGAPTTTNAMFSAAADAEGVTTMRGVGKGWWRLLYQVKGESGDTLLEYLTDEFKMPGGLIINFM